MALKEFCETDKSGIVFSDATTTGKLAHHLFDYRITVNERLAKVMIIPKNLEELAGYVEKGNHVFFFTANWCGDCHFIKPKLPEIEADFPQWQFIQVDRDQFIDVAAQWNIFGIPSFVAIKEGQEQGRLVNKNRKTKEEIEAFLAQLDQATLD